MKNSFLLSITFVIALLAGSFGTYLVLEYNEPSEEDLIEEFYMVENAVHVSPHSLRKKMDKGDDNYILVDLRSQEEYETEHIIGAINIPAYSDPDTSAYGDVERIVNAFSELAQDKDIIVYCYSMPCMTGRKIGLMLTEHGMYVKHLGIGWNEWRYFWTLWNHEHEWNETIVEDYIWSGPEPGTPQLKTESTACTLSGEFGC